MQVALQLEKSVNQSLLDLHKVADSHRDAQVITIIVWIHNIVCHFHLISVSQCLDGKVATFFLSEYMRYGKENCKQLLIYGQWAR